MINSKKLSLVMLLSASMILAGCNNATPSSSDASASSATPSDSSVVPSVDPSSTEETPADVPTQEGATTFYIEVAEDSVALPSWCSYFLTGCMNGWKTTIADGAIELEQLEDTNIYYAIVEGYDDDANKADRGYQVTMGYNESSNLGASSLGINWSYKGQSNNSFANLDHPVFDAPVDGIVHITALWSDGTVDEGGFKWTAALPEPIVAKNYTVKFALSTELAAAVSAWNTEKKASGVTGFAVKGGHNGWAWTPMTKVDDTHYSFTVESIICGVSYEMCVAPLTAAGVDGDAYNLSGTGAKAPDTTDKDGNFHVGNLFFTPMVLDGDNFTFEWGDLVLPEKANGAKEGTYVLPSAVAIQQDLVIELKNTNKNGDGFATGKTPTLASDIAPVAWNPTDATNHFVYDEATQKWSFTFAYDAQAGAKFFYGVSYEFKIVDGLGWEKAAANAGENASFVVADSYALPVVVELDFAKLGVEDQTLSVSYGALLSSPVTITLTDNGTGTLGDGVEPAIPGSFNGWKNDGSDKMTKVDDDTYTYVIASGTLKIGETAEFKIVSSGSWSGAMENGGNNLTFRITDLTKLNVNISGDFSKLGSEAQTPTIVVA